jgi:hypothetical protein
MCDDDGWDYDGFHYYDTKIPDRLSDCAKLFDKHVNIFKIAKQSFKDEVAEKARTLAPKDAFDLRLRCLHFLYPENCPLEGVKQDEDEPFFEYSIYGTNLAEYEWDRTFLRDDDRYDVYFQDLTYEKDRDKWSLNVDLSIKAPKKRKWKMSSNRKKITLRKKR